MTADQNRNLTELRNAAKTAWTAYSRAHDLEHEAKAAARYGRPHASLAACAVRTDRAYADWQDADRAYVAARADLVLTAAA